MFEDKITCILGKNGSGKTNVLDAIHYLAFTKSAINPYDNQNINIGNTGFIVKGVFQVQGKQREVSCAVQLGEKKSVREDDQEYARFSEHVGRYPVVLIVPQDIELIWGGAEYRRKFFDTLFSQVDRQYLENLIVYNHQLKQRNSLLRTSMPGKVDIVLLESYDMKMSEAAHYLFEKRKELLAAFIPEFKKHYSFLTENTGEEAGMSYTSDLEKKPLVQLLKDNWPRDQLMQRTSVGIHRDDFTFLLGGHELKRIGSQGQQKSFLIGLKLAEFRLLANEKGFSPLLLLDDIFDKLDDFRIHQLMRLVCEGAFGQIFITDARAGRSEQILKEAGISAGLFSLENNIFTQQWLKTTT